MHTKIQIYDPWQSIYDPWQQNANYNIDLQLLQTDLWLPPPTNRSMTPDNRSMTPNNRPMTPDNRMHIIIQSYDPDNRSMSPNNRMHTILQIYYPSQQIYDPDNKYMTPDNRPHTIKDLWPLTTDLWPKITDLSTTTDNRSMARAHTCHISYCEIKSHRIWPIWKPTPIGFFKSHRIFRSSYNTFYEEIIINHTYLWLS